MNEYEYKYIETSYSDMDELVDMLNEEGKDGWLAIKIERKGVLFVRDISAEFS